jgi:hypothetical protein
MFIDRSYQISPELRRSARLSTAQEPSAHFAPLDLGSLVSVAVPINIRLLRS